MSTIITVSGMDAGSNSIGFVPPVQSGLKQWFHFGGDAAQSSRNKLAGGGDATAVGPPTFSTGFLSSTGATQRMDTTLGDMMDCTLLCVARSSAAFTSTTTRPTLMGTYASEAGGIGGAALQVSATPSAAPAATINMSASRDNGGVPIQTPATLNVANFAAFTFLAGTAAAGATANARAIYDLTHNTSAFATPATGRKLGLTAIRYANLTSLAQGQCDIAFGAVYDRVLTKAEIDKIYAFVARRLFDKFAIVI